MLRVDGEKPFALLSQAVGQEGWIFYTVTTVLPFPGEIQDKHQERGAVGGDRKTGTGKKERLGEERCWPHSMREAVAFRAPQRSIYLPSVTPLSPACPVSPPSSSSKNGSSSRSFVAWNHCPKIQRPNTSHTTIDSSFLSLLRVLNVNFRALFAQFKCGVKYPHVTIADWEKRVKECITMEVK